MKNLYIITGADGFLGSHIISLLQNKKDTYIRAFVHKYNKSLDNMKCEIYYGDVTKKETLDDIFSNTLGYKVYVIHCAAIIYIKSKYNQNVYNVNVDGTKNVINKCIEVNGKFIYVSSVHAIPPLKNNKEMKEINVFNPKGVKGIYAKTKAIISNYLLDLINKGKIKGCIVMPSGIIGPNDPNMSYMTKLIYNIMNNNMPIIVRGGYNFVDVRDVAQGVINACEMGKNGSVYLLSGINVSIKELYNIISNYSKCKKYKLVLPIWIPKIITPLIEKYYEVKKKTPLFTGYSLYTLKSNSNFNNNLAKNELNFSNRNIKDTIKDIIDWLKDKSI